MGAFIVQSKAEWPILQNGVELNPSDPTQAYSDIAFEGELFDMLEGNLWTWTFTVWALARRTRIPPRFRQTWCSSTMTRRRMAR